MIVEQVINTVKAEKEHPFDNEKLIAWINEVEAEVQEQLGMRPFVPVEHLSDKLQAKQPYDRLYVSYVKAKIDYALEEYASYENNQAQHIADFRDFVDWVVKTSQAINKVPRKLRGIY